ncbi:MAG: Gfo/Idh/MocA family oxidoreductase [Victivallales bacterium]
MTKKIKLGLYGCGLYRTKELVDAIKIGCPESMEIVCGYDANPQTLESAKNLYGFKPCLTLDEFLTCDFDVAMISLPPYLHPDAFEQCASSGKDIYLEKPVCVDDSGREKLRRTMSRHPDVRCYVGLSNRHISPFRKVAELLSRPEAGKIIGVSHHWLSPCIGRNPIPQDKLGWRHRLDQSGGELNQHCCHLFDWFYWIGGEISSVIATAYTPKWSPLPHEETELSACFTYESGALATFNFSQHSHQYVQFGSVNTENFGIKYEWSANSYVKLYRNRPRAAEETWEWTADDLAVPGEDRNVRQIKEFSDAYLSGRPMPIGIEEGIRAYDMVSAIRRSCMEGRSIEIQGIFQLEKGEKWKLN